MISLSIVALVIKKYDLAMAKSIKNAFKKCVKNNKTHSPFVIPP